MSEEVSTKSEEDLIPNNARLFRLAISNCFEHIAESVSEQEFLEILTILKEKKPSVAQKLHKAMMKELYNGMNSDLEEIFQEGSLQSGLSKVYQLAEETNIPIHEKAWRPPGNVALHLRSLDAEKIREASEELEEQVIKIESENELLKKQVEERRINISATNDRITRLLNKTPSTLQRLECRVKEIESSLKALNGDPSSNV